MILEGGNRIYPVRHEGVLAAVLLALALFDMPYRYYQFLRWLIMIIGVSIAFEGIAQRQRWLFFFGLSVAALFNPFFKVAFDKGVWWWIDLALAGAFLLVGLTVQDETKQRRDEELIECSLDDE